MTPTQCSCAVANLRKERLYFAMKISMEIPSERAKELEDLAAATQMTLKDLLNNALTILTWAADEARAGREIASVDEVDKSYRVLLNAFLQKAAEAPLKQSDEKVA